MNTRRSVVAAIEIKAILGLAVVILTSLCAGSRSRAASDADKLEKSENVLAYPQAAKARAGDFYDNSFVAALEKAGFFQKLGTSR